MENLDDSENNAKISDSAYSNSCSNSQSRRSHSSKSTHSGSHSSGSSGYGGKPSTGSSDAFSQPPEKRFKEAKKKKQPQTESIVSEQPKESEVLPEALPKESEVEMNSHSISEDVATSPATSAPPKEQFSANTDASVTEQSSVQEEVNQTPTPTTSTQIVPFEATSNLCYDGFSCVISMHDGVVIYTTSSVTNAVGFPKEMWIGRSFIDFVHPKDRNTFASQITSGLFTPTSCGHSSSASTMFCRIRQYRTLGSAGFSVKERNVIYLPFQLNISFKDINDDEGKVIYLVIQAKPIFSIYKTPNEVIANPVPFVVRHISNGCLEYLDPKSIPFLGYLPQEIINKCILHLYHPEDLVYIRQIYETIVREGKSERSKAYRLLSQNGDYVKLETEWSSFINPWSKKLEFIVAKHYVMEGPTNPDVFMQPTSDAKSNDCEEENSNVKLLRDDMIRIMNEVLTKPAETAKQHMSKRCQDLALFMESLIEEEPKPDDELRLEIHEPDERDSVMLGGISPHHDNVSKTSGTETPLSYNQLNYNENLQRYFERHEPLPHNYFPLESSNREYAISQGRRLSPMAANYGDSGDGSSSGSGPNMSQNGSVESCNNLNNRCVKLTETLLNKHNAEMEKKLVKKHRETRIGTKTERERASNETKKKKKEHLARCNVSYEIFRRKKSKNSQSHGVKRTCHRLEQDKDKNCTSSKQFKSTPSNNKKTSNDLSTPAVSTWTIPPVTAAHTFVQPMSPHTQPVPLVNPVTAIPAGVIPIYYVPPSTTASAADNNNKTQFPASVPYIMYPQPVFNSQFVYSPVNSQVAFPVAGQPAANAALPRQMMTEKPFMLSNSNYEQIFEPGPSFLKHRSNTRGLTSWRDKKQIINKNNVACTMADHSSSNSSSVNATSDNNKVKGKSDIEEAVDRTDCESSYSSFYSSFFKTESGSLEESSDRKNKASPFPRPQNYEQTYVSCGESEGAPFEKRYCHNKSNFFTKRKPCPPWLDQVSVTSELIYKYQILAKDLNDVLQSDMKKIASMKQPSIVNEQLGQLYLDLQLEGVAARLTLEEGITSSGSSAEDVCSVNHKKRKATYSKLVMVYEEDAPMPPPDPEQSVSSPPPESKINAPVLPLEAEQSVSLLPVKDSPLLSCEPVEGAPVTTGSKDGVPVTALEPEENASLLQPI